MLQKILLLFTNWYQVRPFWACNCLQATFHRLMLVIFFFFAHVLSAICFNFLPSSWWHQVWKIWSKSDLIHYKTKFLKIYYFKNLSSTGCLSTLSLVWLILNLFSGPNILQTVFWKINDLISPVRSKVTIFGHLRAVRLKEVECCSNYLSRCPGTNFFKPLKRLYFFDKTIGVRKNPFVLEIYAIWSIFSMNLKERKKDLSVEKDED